MGALIGLNKVPRLNLFIQIVVTFILISLSRVFFRARSVEDAFTVFKKMLTFKGSIFNDGTAIIIYSFLAMFMLLIVEFKREFYTGSFSFSHNKNFWVRTSYYSILVLLIILVGVFDGGQFIYFQF